MQTTSARIDTRQQMTQEEWEATVAFHVQSLVALGWRWEGRGIIPGWEPWHALSKADS